MSVDIIVHKSIKFKDSCNLNKLTDFFKEEYNQDISDYITDHHLALSKEKTVVGFDSDVSEQIKRQQELKYLGLDLKDLKLFKSVNINIDDKSTGCIFQTERSKLRVYLSIGIWDTTDDKEFNEFIKKLLNYIPLEHMEIYNCDNDSQETTEYIPV